MIGRLSLAILVSMVTVISCIEPYTLSGIKANPDFLVVDGFINASDNSARVRLSKAVSLDFSNSPPPVYGAEVSIETTDGQEFWLEEVDVIAFPKDSGVYIIENLPIDFQQQYRLKISLRNGGNKYVSEFITIQRAATLEDISWRADEGNLKILITTSANEGTSQYYRWRYEETYEYNSPLFSVYYVEDSKGKQRSVDEFMYTCYRTDPSMEILIGSSQNLTTNSIRNFPLKAIDRRSIKIALTYSIKVEQLALSEDAYSYWLNLFKTTENMGGLFDPLPGQVTGNIQGISDPRELVIGFFSGSTVESKRIFVSRHDLPKGYVDYRSRICKVDTVLIADMDGMPNNTPLYSAIYADGFPVVIGYTLSERVCLDCRLYGGGTLTKPDFWP